MNSQFWVGKLTRPALFISVLTGITFAFPSNIPTQNFISVRSPLLIKASRSTPPRAVFEDLVVQIAPIGPRESEQDFSSDTAFVNTKKTSLLSTASIRPIHEVAAQKTSKSHALKLAPARFSRIESEGVVGAPVENLNLADLNPSQINRLQFAKQKSEIVAELVQAKTEVEKSRNYLESIRGELMFSGSQGGMPFGPGFSIELRRVEDNIPKEFGTVDPVRGEFAIKIPEREGSLVARVYNEAGFVVGEGKYRLGGDSSGRPKIRIQPRQNRFVGSVGDFYSGKGGLFHGLGEARQVEGYVYNASSSQMAPIQGGEFELDSVAEGSEVAVRFLPISEDKEAYLTIIRSQSENKLALPVIPKTFTASLREVAREAKLRSDFDRSDSLVVGQVLSEGEPVMGARVAIESAPEAQVIYLNKFFLPDTELTTTSELGYFVVVDLPEGFHSAKAYLGNDILGNSNFPSESETTTLVRIDVLSRTYETQLKVFDAFLGSPQEATISLQAFNDEMTVAGSDIIMLAQGSALGFMRVTPKDPTYAESMQVYSHNADHVHAMLLKESWVKAISAEARINSNPDTGVVVGFSPTDKVEVFLPHTENFAKENIVYFNSVGSRVSDSVVGGGFLIFNVPNGVQSISVFSETQGVLQSRVIPVDSQSLSVLNFAF